MTNQDALSVARSLPAAPTARVVRGVDGPPPAGRQIIPIILYHAIDDDPPPWIAPFSVAPATFAAHLDAMLAAGCQPLTVSELVDRLDRGGGLPARPVVVTFDDGFADTAERAAPALAARGMPATVYVTTAALAGRRSQPHRLPPARMLRWDQLADLEVAGVEIGAHSETHRDLDVLAPAAAWAEIAGSKARLEEALGHPVRSFAYPHGYYTPRIAAMVSHAGFDSACAVKNALSATDDHRFALARLTVKASTTTALIAHWLAGRGAPLPFPHQRARTRAWSLYRRLSAVRGSSNPW